MSRHDHFRVSVNTCAYEVLRALPGVGQMLAYRIWECRKQGHITEEDFATIT